MPLAIQTAVGSKRTELKKRKFEYQTRYASSSISNASPSLKDTIMKDHRKGTHFPDIVTGLTMGSTTFEEVGVW